MRLKLLMVLVLSLALLPVLAVAQDDRPDTYPWHKNIVTTMFYIGEKPSPDNAFISNEDSAWTVGWTDQFGCVDDPNNRVGYLPAACFEAGMMGPLENPFYFALPFGDYAADGVLPQVNLIQWYTAEHGSVVYANGGSLLKNRWIEISRLNTETGVARTAYAQWQDIGPFNWDDGEYVWGNAQPAYQDEKTGDRIGLDVSPAVNDYLGLGGRGETSWRFIDAEDVPDGWWKAVVTTSPPKWN